MKRCLLLFCLLVSCKNAEDSAIIQSSQAAVASPTAFEAYVRSYERPQFFSKNSQALDARLKLLDMAPANSHARIASFIFDNGFSTRLLSRHICLAAGRGVKVELLVDSKSGSRAGIDDAFDTSEDKQVVEEMLQYIANCGARVYIHNNVESYIEIFGRKIPNIFLDPALEHENLGPFQILTIYNRLNYLYNKFVDLVEREFRREGIATEVKPMLHSVRNLVLDSLFFSGTKNDPILSLGMPNQDKPSSRSFVSNYEDFLDDSFWDKITAPKLRVVLSRVEKQILADPEFSHLIQVIRRFNRLNHRKLFLVENEKSSEGCMFVGGRNLGDLYLADNADSFFDGDVLLCRHHQDSGDRSAIDQGTDSFTGLVTDESDPFLHIKEDNNIRLVKVNKNYVFRHLLFPAELAPKGLRTKGLEGDLPSFERTLVKEKAWPNKTAIMGDLELGSARGWHLLLAGWNKDQDQIRAHLLAKIRNEQKEIYLETAYAEFNEELRSAIEGALARGVRVQLITNSFFTLDGSSKIIRILMNNWMEKTMAAYPSLFDVHFTALSGGHMTHFKAAAFACQNENGSLVRSYMVGSHNFHPRSGLADKEHALVWEEASDCETKLGDVSLVKARHGFYNSLSARMRKRLLDKYPDLLKEFSVVARLYREGGETNQEFAQVLRDMFYEETAVGVWRIRNRARALKVFNLIDNGGLHDLIGRIL